MSREWVLIPALLFSTWLSGQNSDAAQAQALEQQGKLAEAQLIWQAMTRRNPNDAAAC